MLIRKTIVVLELGCALLMLSACTNMRVEPKVNYATLTNTSLYQLEQWTLDGRLALTGKNDSWQASINWVHQPENEAIKLAGPLGQGATTIQLTGDRVTLDRGDGKVQSSNQPEAFINQQLGMFVPIRSLRYWVVGLPEPGQAFIKTAEGFTQAGWLVEYPQMQRIDRQAMPRKMTVTNAQIKLKLIIDQWALNVAKPQ